MILCRSPYRISLGGGGTDLPSYYQAHQAYFISAAINYHTFIALGSSFNRHITIRAPEYKQYASFADIEHPMIKQAFKLLNFEPQGLELISMADLPMRSGLGSSGSFLVCLLKALSYQQGKSLTATELAELAFNIEAVQLNKPVGKQDQYIAALGGIRAFTISEKGIVQSRPLNLSSTQKAQLCDNLVLFFTGKQRDSAALLAEQQQKSQQADQKMLDNLHHIKLLAKQTVYALEQANFDEFGLIMDEHWQLKQKRSKHMCDDAMQIIYQYALKHGALGGKLIGAGGGGFFMFYCQDKAGLIKAMANFKLKALSINIDEGGVCCLQQ